MSPRRDDNVFAHHGVDRDALSRADEERIAALLTDPETRFVPVCGDRHPVLHESGEPQPALLDHRQVEPLLAAAEEPVFLGRRRGRAYFALALPEEARDLVEAATAGETALRDLKGFGTQIGAELASLLAYARGMAYWHERHRFCGDCGTATASRQAGHLRTCSNAACDRDHFPRTDPAVIVLVTHGERALLGRQAIWPATMFSTLAGFVEPGESLEAAVAREVLEEAGVEIDGVRYASSQPWPFPSSLMLGFYAEALDEALDIDYDELETARWFSRSELEAAVEGGSVSLPRPVSIAYRLIADWLSESGDWLSAPG